MAQANGKLVQIQGGVIDVEFGEDNMPAIYEALDIPLSDGGKVILEVEKQLGGGLARCVAMDTTDGLQRGMPAIRTYAPIMVPVGEGVLGRIFDVVGETVDNLGPLKTDTKYPIHRQPPAFEDNPAPNHLIHITRVGNVSFKW